MDIPILSDDITFFKTQGGLTFVRPQGSRWEVFGYEETFPTKDEAIAFIEATIALQGEKP